MFVLGIWQNTFARFGEDWFFLAFLGVISSLLSFSMDYAISMCQKCKWLTIFRNYLQWILYIDNVFKFKLM